MDNILKGKKIIVLMKDSGKNRTNDTNRRKDNENGEKIVLRMFG